MTKTSTLMCIISKVVYIEEFLFPCIFEINIWATEASRHLLFLPWIWEMCCKRRAKEWNIWEDDIIFPTLSGVPVSSSSSLSDSDPESGNWDSRKNAGELGSGQRSDWQKAGSITRPFKPHAGCREWWINVCVCLHRPSHSNQHQPALPRLQILPQEPRWSWFCPWRLKAEQQADATHHLQGETKGNSDPYSLNVYS